MTIPYYDDGQVTLYCGDCRDILPELAPGSVDLVLADPPYGIALQENGRNGYNWTIAGDESQELGQVVVDWAAAHALPTIVFAGAKRPWAGSFRQHLVWDKGPAVGGGGDPATCWKQTWELIQVARTGKLNGSRDSAVLTFWVGQRDYHNHPAEKPVKLITYLLAKTTQPGDLILDPFMGSGPVAKACQMTGRRYVGIEIEERYCEIAAKRLQQQALLVLS